MARRTVFNGDKPANNWVKMEQARLKNLELECIDILNDRDNQTLMLHKRIEELNSLYNYGYGRTI